MDLLINVALAGMATGFATEVLIKLFTVWLPPRIIRIFASLPLSYFALYLLEVQYPSILVATLAAGFFSNALLLILDRAPIVNIRR